MKALRIGGRKQKAQAYASPFDHELMPALVGGRWHVPDQFNVTRDVVEALASDPQRNAVTCLGVDGVIERRTFIELASASARWASFLRARGVLPGDSVLVVMPSNCRSIEVALGCLKIGAITVPASPTLPASTLEIRADGSGASLVVAERRSERTVAEVASRPLVFMDEATPWGGGPTAPEPTDAGRSSAPAFIVSTSGTAGGPRPVVHTHASMFGARVQAEHWLGVRSHDVVWCTADAGSTVTLWSALFGSWARGAETVMHDGEFEPLERLELLHRLGVTVLCQSPAEYQALAQLRELPRLRPPLLRRLVSTGDYLDPEVISTFKEVWDLVIHDGYGQTETGVVVANGVDAGFRLGSLGRPLPGHNVAVIDSDGNTIPPRTEGVLAVRDSPPTMFAGYWESPQETREAFAGDWYVTGDVATVDEDGFLWFVARTSNLIASHGHVFGPHDLERMLRRHQAVSDAAVVGVRDVEHEGSFVRAFVVPTPATEGSEQLEVDLRRFLEESLELAHVPREIEFVAELPRTANGKLRHLELRDRPVLRRSVYHQMTAWESK